MKFLEDEIMQKQRSFCISVDGTLRRQAFDKYIPKETDNADDENTPIDQSCSESALTTHWSVDENANGSERKRSKSVETGPYEQTHSNFHSSTAPNYEQLSELSSLDESQSRVESWPQRTVTHTSVVRGYQCVVPMKPTPLPMAQVGQTADGANGVISQTARSESASVQVLEADWKRAAEIGGTGQVGKSRLNPVRQHSSIFRHGRPSAASKSVLTSSSSLMNVSEIGSSSSHSQGQSPFRDLPTTRPSAVPAALATASNATKVAGVKNYPSDISELNGLRRHTPSPKTKRSLKRSLSKRIKNWFGIKPTDPAVTTSAGLPPANSPLGESSQRVSTSSLMSATARDKRHSLAAVDENYLKKMFGGRAPNLDTVSVSEEDELDEESTSSQILPVPAQTVALPTKSGRPPLISCPPPVLQLSESPKRRRPINNRTIQPVQPDQAETMTSEVVSISDGDDDGNSTNTDQRPPPLPPRVTVMDCDMNPKTAAADQLATPEPVDSGANPNANSSLLESSIEVTDIDQLCSLMSSASSFGDEMAAKTADEEATTESVSSVAEELEVIPVTKIDDVLADDQPNGQVTPSPIGRSLLPDILNHDIESPSSDEPRILLRQLDSIADAWASFSRMCVVPKDDGAIAGKFGVFANSCKSFLEFVGVLDECEYPVVVEEVINVVTDVDGLTPFPIDQLSSLVQLCLNKLLPDSSDDEAQDETLTKFTSYLKLDYINSLRLLLNLTGRLARLDLMDNLPKAEIDRRKEALQEQLAEAIGVRDEVLERGADLWRSVVRQNYDTNGHGSKPSATNANLSTLTRWRQFVVMTNSQLFVESAKQFLVRCGQKL